MKLTRRSLLSLLPAAGMSSYGPAFAAATPKRNMIVRSANPEDLEMPLDGFQSWITPIDRFFVRSHHYTPQVKLAEWKLNVSGEVSKPLSLVMDDLKKLPRIELVSVVECAGNGRSLYDPPVPGVQWVYGAVGNGRWTGVRLADVLKMAGVKPSAVEVLFDGADVTIGAMPEFQRTVPIKKALDPDTLLAYEMNGQTLPVSHGFPLRLVVPGWAGDSWVKWVTSIRVLDREFDGFWMKTAYRHPGKPVRPGVGVDPAQMHPVTSLGIKSVITGPQEDSQHPAGPVRITGVAWSGETSVRDVEVSMDRGRTWTKARMGREQARYGWRLFEASWTPPSPGHYVLMSRAFDANGRTQPIVQEWNPSGYLHNVVHKVAVESVAGKPAAAVPAARLNEGAVKDFSPPAAYRPACLPCHGEDVIMQQRLTRVQWEREIDKMVRWGAQVKPSDREPILEYLLRLYGPRPLK